MRTLDLFSGIGGFALGFQWAGFPSPVAFCERDEFCQLVLRKHWPDVPIHPDIRELCADAVGPVDLICGGFPCKQTSRAAAIHGRRVGLIGADSGLWHEMLRLVRDASPRLCVVENPPGEWEAEAKEGLARAGYRVSRLPCSAGEIGAPHPRRRVFLLADRDGSGLEIARVFQSSQARGFPGRASARNTWLPSDAGALRVADGVPGGPYRRERITALGNAVMPAKVEQLGRAILS